MARETKANVGVMQDVPPGSHVDLGNDAPAPTAEASADPATTAWSFSPTAKAAALDLGAAVTPDMVAPEPRPVGTVGTTSATGGVSEGLAERDVQLGMGRGGAVLTALEDAARAGDTPTFGVATFDVEVRADGVRARVVGADGDPSPWSRVAASVERTFDPQRMRIPPGARGWRVVARIESKVVLADGRDVRTLHGLRATVTPSQLADAMEGKARAGASSTGAGGPDHVGGGPSEPPPAGGALGKRAAGNPLDAAAGLMARVLPTPSVSITGKVCSASLGLTPMGLSLGGGCSPENIGMPEQRVVSGRIVSESSL
jgi:hypothetical protein